tara:strand:+ start:245 stop:430 length:186 start_codon:yes stop_codon:yes gene_type:complete
MKNKTNYKSAADMTRRCKTQERLARREKNNQNLYDNGCLTVSEYSRLAVIEMEIKAKIESR